jgi:hypothetical protein
MNIMTDSEIRDKVVQLRTAVFGVEGHGGLVHEVDSMREQITQLERKVNVISGKWLALMTLLAILGNAIVSSIFKFATVAPLLHK